MKNNTELVSILKDFHKVTGARISIHNQFFEEIAGYPESLTMFCREVQKNPKIKNHCIESDRFAFEKVKSTGVLYTYKCGCGLTETVAPIYHYGVISGYFMMGQISETDDLSNIEQKCISLFDSKESCSAAVAAIHVLQKDKFDSYVNILSVLAEYLTMTNSVAPKFTDIAEKTHHYLNANYGSKISVDMLCETFFCSRTTLMNKFRKTYGMTVFEYLNNIRLEKSAELLCKTKESIKNTALQCGFTDQNYFSKIFYKKYGCSPTDYRKSFYINK